MTFDEYVKAMDEYADRLKNTEDDADDLLDEISEFQYEYMRNILKEYVVDSEAKQACYEILNYAVNWSQSGNSIYYVDSEELAEEVNEIIWEELGDYLLDCEVYEEDGEWAIDCMFCGYFVPEWDGRYDD